MTNKKLSRAKKKIENIYNITKGSFKKKKDTKRQKRIKTGIRKQLLTL